MCLGGAPPAPVAPTTVPVQQVVAPPPPPPARAPEAPLLDATNANNKNKTANERKGTSIFRNDLSIPSASSVGTGINIPTA